LSVGTALKLVLYPPHLRRTVSIAAAVGTWLTVFNQGDTLIAGGASTLVLGKIVLNYLTPFVVANLGLLSADPGRRGK
jgi:hypothetical protein